MISSEKNVSLKPTQSIVLTMSVYLTYRHIGLPYISGTCKARPETQLLGLTLARYPRFQSGYICAPLCSIHFPILNNKHLEKRVRKFPKAIDFSTVSISSIASDTIFFFFLHSKSKVALHIGKGMGEVGPYRAKLRVYSNSWICVQWLPLVMLRVPYAVPRMT